MSKKEIIIIAIVLLLLTGGILGLWQYLKWWEIKNIDSFSACARHYPVLETYPEQCRTPDGRTFVKKTMEDYVRSKYIPPGTGCTNLCGDEICQEVVCQAIGCPCAETKEICPQDCAGTSDAGLANPASVNCENLGGQLDIRTDASGGQVGYCQFSNGHECEEWALFKGECQP